MALRLSLGAGRGRLVRQLLTESVVFAVVAGVVAVGLAFFATRLLGSLALPIDGPWDVRAELDSTVLLFTGTVSLAAGVLFGMAPALQATRPDTMAAVKGEMRSPGRSRMSSTLVVVQVALSLVLLVGSGLFLRSLQGATRIDPGFDRPEQILTAAFDPTLQGYDGEEGWALVDGMIAEIREMPGVAEGGVVSLLPLSLNTSDWAVGIPGYEFAPGERRSIHYAHATEGYLEAMGVQVVEGRTFQRSDDARGEPVIVINQVFAERFWPGESALGKIVEADGERRVIGVVETGKYTSLGEDPLPYMYLAARQSRLGQMTVVARTPGDPAHVMPRIREVVRSVAPTLPLYDVRTMEDHMGVVLLPARLGGSALALFGILGLTLAAVGIYGVMAYSVSQRRREVGIRVALGARRSDVVGMVLRQGLGLAILGTLVGLAGAVLLGRVVEGFLYGVSALDPVAFTVVPVVLLGVAALAVYIPARRAAACDPLVALRSE
jgi:predicted permease